VSDCRNREGVPAANDDNGKQKTAAATRRCTEYEVDDNLEVKNTVN